MTLLDARYELGPRLGAGGMAVVVEGYDRKLERRVAVKLLRGGLEDARSSERFVREAQHAAGFSHPNVVAVYDVGATEGRPYLVMELVDGRTLQQLLASRGPLPVDHALRIAEALLAALSAAHSRGLVHRDVKPGNVLLGDDGSVKLADFGIAKAVREGTLALTATGQMLGTPNYLAPEVVDGHEATPQTDLYAVGVVLFEMLTGSPPFTGEHPTVVALAHRDQPAPSVDDRRPGVPPSVSAVVARALEKDPSRRFTDATEMRAALRVPEGSGVAGASATVPLDAVSATRSLPVVTPAPRSPSRARRWGVRVLAASLVVLAATAVALVAVSTDAGGPDGVRTTDTTVAPSTVPPTAPPTTVPVPTTTPVPRTVDALIALLAASPDAFGERGEDLLRDLEKLQERASPGREFQIRRDILEWLERGEIDPAIAAAALDVLGSPFGGGDAGGDEGEDGFDGRGSGGD